MYIAAKPPFRFADGESLSPAAINENNEYVLQAINSVADEKTMTWTSSFSLVPDVATPLTASTDSAHLKRNIPPFASRSIGGATVIANSASIVAYYTASVAWAIVFYDTYSNPITVTMPARAAALATVPYFLTELFNIELDSAFTRCINVTPAGTMSVTKLDIDLGFTANKFECGDHVGSVASPVIPENLGDFTDAVPDDPAIFVTKKAQIDALCASVKEGIPVSWMLGEVINATSATATPLRRTVLPSFVSPSFSPVETAPLVIGIWFDGVFSSASGGTLSFGVAQLSGSYTAQFATTTIDNIILQAGALNIPAAFRLTSDYALQVTVPAGVTLIRGTIFAICQ